MSITDGHGGGGKTTKRFGRPPSLSDELTQLRAERDGCRVTLGNYRAANEGLQASYENACKSLNAARAERDALAAKLAASEYARREERLRTYDGLVQENARLRAVVKYAQSVVEHPHMDTVGPSFGLVLDRMAEALAALDAAEERK